MRRFVGASLLLALVLAVVTVRCLLPEVRPEPPAATSVPPAVVLPASPLPATATPTETPYAPYEFLPASPMPTATETPTPEPTPVPPPPESTNTPSRPMQQRG